MFAQITDNQITATRRELPDRGKRLDNGDIVLALPDADPATQQACGWFAISEVPQPPYNTDTQRITRSVEVIDGQPTVVWTVTDLTADELADRAAEAADEQEREQLKAADAWLADVAQNASREIDRQFARAIRFLIRKV